MRDPSFLYTGIASFVVLCIGIYLTDKFREKKSGASKLEKFLVDQLETEKIPRFSSSEEAGSFVAKFQDSQRARYEELFGPANIKDHQVLCDNIVLKMCTNGMIPEKDWRSWPVMNEAI